MRADPSRAIGLALCRLLVALPLLLAVSFQWGESLQRALLPGIQGVIEVWDDTYRIESILLDRQGPDRVVRIWVSQARCVVIGDAAHCPDPRGRAQASTLAGNLDLVAWILILGMVAWPVRQRVEWLWRMLLVGPMACLIWSLDVPMVLWGGIWSLHHDAYAPQAESALLSWVDFVQSGGRQVLSLIGIWGAIALARRMVEKR